MLFGPSGFMSLDRAMGVFYFAEMDINSQFDDAMHGYSRLRTKELFGENCNQDDIFQRPFAYARFNLKIDEIVMADQFDDIPMLICHPAIRQTGDLEISSYPVHNPMPSKEWFHNCTIKYFSGFFSRLDKTVYAHDNIKLIDTPLSSIYSFRAKLSEEKIKSCLIDSYGNRREVPSSFWNSETGWEVLSHNITAHIYVDGVYISGKIYIETDSFLNDYYDRCNKINAFLREKNEEEDIIYKPSDYNELAKSIDKGYEIRGPGAPEKYDKVLFLAGAFNHIWISGNVPGDVTKLSKAAIKFYTEAGGINAPPSDKWAWNTTNELWKKMGLRAGEKAPEGD